MTSIYPACVACARGREGRGVVVEGMVGGGGKEGRGEWPEGRGEKVWGRGGRRGWQRWNMWRGK